MQRVLFGPEAVFTLEHGTKTVLERGHLRLEQEGAAIVLAEDGAVMLHAGPTGHPQFFLIQEP